MLKKIKAQFIICNTLLGILLLSITLVFIFYIYRESTFQGSNTICLCEFCYKCGKGWRICRDRSNILSVLCIQTTTEAN